MASVHLSKSKPARFPDCFSAATAPRPGKGHQRAGSWFWNRTLQRIALSVHVPEIKSPKQPRETRDC